MTVASPHLVALEAFRGALIAEVGDESLRAGLDAFALARAGSGRALPGHVVDELGAAALTDAFARAAQTVARFVGDYRGDGLSTRQAVVASLVAHGLDAGMAQSAAHAAWRGRSPGSPLTRDEVRSGLCLDVVAPLCGLARWAPYEAEG